mgnify:CR=1 FL=1
MRYPVKREFISVIYKKQEDRLWKKSDFYKNWYKKYKKMTRELLEESNLAELIGDKNKMVGIQT